MEANELARKTAELAARDIGVKEKGQNRGKRIEQYQATVGIKPPAPYCIAAVCTWIKEACQELGLVDATGRVVHELLFSPSVLRFWDYAGKTGNRYSPDVLTAECLPCIGIIDHGKGQGHAFLIVGLNDDGSLSTIDANSNAAGVRDGQGVVALADRHKATDLLGWVRIA